MQIRVPEVPENATPELTAEILALNTRIQKSAAVDGEIQQESQLLAGEGYAFPKATKLRQAALAALEAKVPVAERSVTLIDGSYRAQTVKNRDDKIQRCVSTEAQIYAEVEPLGWHNRPGERGYLPSGVVRTNPRYIAAMADDDAARAIVDQIPAMIRHNLEVIEHLNARIKAFKEETLRLP